MRTSQIKATLSQNEPAICVQLHRTDPSMFELASLMGFDDLWMDLEYHGHRVQTAGQLMRAARVGSSDIVARPAKGESIRIGRLLELAPKQLCTPAATMPQNQPKSSVGQCSPRRHRHCQVRLRRFASTVQTTRLSL